MLLWFVYRLSWYMDSLDGGLIVVVGSLLTTLVDY